MDPSLQNVSALLNEKQVISWYIISAVKNVFLSGNTILQNFSYFLTLMFRLY